jgi:hypothetical protein
MRALPVPIYRVAIGADTSQTAAVGRAHELNNSCRASTGFSRLGDHPKRACLSLKVGVGLCIALSTKLDFGQSRGMAECVYQASLKDP